MLPLHCRQCSAPVRETDQHCPACGCKSPFACAECGKPLSHYTLRTRRSSRHPHGGYSAAGVPVCHEHRLTRCHKCRHLFPMGEMKERVIGRREDTNLRKGMKPRMEDAMAMFCAGCDRPGGVVVDSEKTQQGRFPVGLLVVVALVLACAGVPMLWLVLTHRL